MSQKKPPPSYESVLLSEWGAEDVLKKKKGENRKKQNPASEGTEPPTVYKVSTTTPEPLYKKMSPQAGNLGGYVSQDELGLVNSPTAVQAQSPAAGAGQRVGVYNTTNPKPQSRAAGAGGQGGIESVDSVDSSERLYAEINESEVNKGESDETRAKGAVKNDTYEMLGEYHVGDGVSTDPQNYRVLSFSELYAEIQNKSLWQRLKEIFSNAVEWIREKWSSVTGRNKSVQPGASSFQNPIYGESPSLHETKSRVLNSETAKTPTGRNRSGGATEPVYAEPTPLSSREIANPVHQAASAAPNYSVLSRDGRVSQAASNLANGLATSVAASATASQNSSDGISAAQSDAQPLGSDRGRGGPPPAYAPTKRTQVSAAAEALAAAPEAAQASSATTDKSAGAGAVGAETNAVGAASASVASSATQGPDVSAGTGAGGADAARDAKNYESSGGVTRKLPTYGQSEAEAEAAAQASSAPAVRPGTREQTGNGGDVEVSAKGFKTGQAAASVTTQGPDVSPTAGAGGRDGGARNNSNVSEYTAPVEIVPAAAKVDAAERQAADPNSAQAKAGAEASSATVRRDVRAGGGAVGVVVNAVVAHPQAEGAGAGAGVADAAAERQDMFGYTAPDQVGVNKAASASVQRQAAERQAAERQAAEKQEASRGSSEMGRVRVDAKAAAGLSPNNSFRTPATVDMARLASENSPLLKCLEDFVAKGRWPENYSTSSTEEFVQQIHQESGGLVRNLVQGGFLRDDTSVYETLKSQGGRKIYPLKLEELNGKRIFMPKFNQDGSNMVDKDGNQIMDVLKIGTKPGGGIGVIDGIIMPPPDSSSISQELIDDLQLAHGIKRSLEDVQKQAIDIVATPLILSAQSIGGTPPITGQSTQQQINTVIDREYAEQYRKAAIYDLANRKANPTMRGVEPTPHVIDRTLAFMLHLGGDQESLKKLELQTTELAKGLIPPKTKEPKFQQDYANFCADAHRHVAAYHALQENRFRALVEIDKQPGGSKYWKECADLAAKLKKMSLDDAGVNQLIATRQTKQNIGPKKPLVKSNTNRQRSPTNT